MSESKRYAYKYQRLIYGHSTKLKIGRDKFNYFVYNSHLAGRVNSLYSLLLQLKDNPPQNMDELIGDIETLFCEAAKEMSFSSNQTYMGPEIEDIMAFTNQRKQAEK